MFFLVLVIFFGFLCLLFFVLNICWNLKFNKVCKLVIVIKIIEFLWLLLLFVGFFVGINFLWWKVIMLLLFLLVFIWIFVWLMNCIISIKEKEKNN